MQITAAQGSKQLLPPITQGRRAVLVRNMGPTGSSIGFNESVRVGGNNGFIMAAGDAVALACMCAVWAGAGNWNVLVLSK